MKKRLFNKRGMTYVELLVALALLALIVVSFTPMLVSSYETLYKAGEKTEEVYDSQQEIERGLAVRSSTREGSVAMSFRMNAANVFETMNVNGRKVVSTLQDKLETIFYGVRARIDILTPDVVYDDTLTHDVILQTTGIPFTDVKKRSEYTGNIEDMPEDLILIDAFIPDKHTGSNGTTTDENVYRNIRASLTITEEDAVNGRISFTLGGADFTQSPIKIVIYYKNERGIAKTLSDYLYIEPASILMGGTSKNYDYYTSAGLEEVDASNSDQEHKIIYQLSAQGRTMRIENSPYLKKYYDTPKATGTIIRNITWVDTDEDANISPYYVMIGTNGAMYRMYNYNNHTSDIYNLSIGNTSRPNTDGYTTTDGLTGWDNTFDTEEGYRVCASLWSGDKAHVFDFSSWQKSMNYGLDEEGGNDNCWLTAEQYVAKAGTTIIGIPISGDKVANSNKGAEKYNLFGMRAKFSYYLNGYRVGFNYPYQTARNMSYIITETGSPLRAFGFLKNEDDFMGFTEIWYPSGLYTVIGKDKSNSDKNTIVVFSGTTGGGPDGGRHSETAYASIRFANFGSYDPNVDTLVNFMRTDGEATSDREQARQITDGYESLKGLESEINLTDAIYIPGAGSVKGSMLYLGTVHAYMNVMQKDNISGTANRAAKITNAAKNKKLDEDEYAPNGALTDYVIFGNAEGTGTTVHKYSSASEGVTYVDRSIFNTETGLDEGQSSLNGVSAAEKQARMAVTSGNKLSGDARSNFFIARQTSWKDMFMDDVLFTMGYSSNREKVYTNVTYDGQREYYRSYEHFYFHSHYGIGGVNADGTPNKVATRATHNNATNRNVYNNDYYNVWFPGEMYNLTKVASKEGITVAVGYTVAGSAYQWINPNQTSNTSTALGGIYNDGVLAAMVEGSQSEFTNLLYFKDNTTFDSNYLTTSYSGSAPYTSAFGTYGTHERDSVQFTAVDINSEIEYDGTTTSGKKHYYAYYGDSKGRVFVSKVATSQVTVTSTDDENVVMTENTTLVDFIADTTYAGTVAAPSTMKEIKINDTTSLSQYFSKIISIEADNDMVIISGTAKTLSTNIAVVVGVKDANNNWTWKRVQLTAYTGLNIYATKVVGGVYYFAGDAQGGGFFAAVKLDTLRLAQSNSIISDALEKTDDPNKVVWVGPAVVPDIIYAMDGRDTR